ncbi:GntR family transcriptional regulator [Rummeliibacillus sp. JY-2-4R]
MTSFNQVKGHSKSEKVYDYIRNAILTGIYKPGDRLIIREISKKLGVSDIPVREAIKNLESDGLVQLKKNSGARVATLDLETLEEIFMLRLELETLATKLAAKNRTAEEVEDINFYVEVMEACSEKMDVANYTRYNRKFHDTVYQASHSPILLDFISNLLVRSENSNSIFKHNPDRIETSINEHRSIAIAIEQGNEQEAERQMHKHKEVGFDMVMNSLKFSQSYLGI